MYMVVVAKLWPKKAIHWSTVKIFRLGLMALAIGFENLNERKRADWPKAGPTVVQ